MLLLLLLIILLIILSKKRQEAHERARINELYKTHDYSEPNTTATPYEIYTEMVDSLY